MSESGYKLCGSLDHDPSCPDSCNVDIPAIMRKLSADSYRARKWEREWDFRWGPSWDFVWESQRRYDLAPAVLSPPADALIEVLVDVGVGVATAGVVGASKTLLGFRKKRKAVTPEATSKHTEANRKALADYLEIDPTRLVCKSVEANQSGELVGEYTFSGRNETKRFVITTILSRRKVKVIALQEAQLVRESTLRIRPAMTPRPRPRRRVN